MKRLAVCLSLAGLLWSADARAQSALDVGLELTGGVGASVVLGGTGVGLGFIYGLLTSEPDSLWTDLALWSLVGGTLGAGLGGWLGVTTVAGWRKARGDEDGAIYGAMAGFLVGVLATIVPFAAGLMLEHPGLLRMGVLLSIPAVLAPGIGATIGFNTGRKELMSVGPGPVKGASGTAPGLVFAARF